MKLSLVIKSAITCFFLIQSFALQAQQTPADLNSPSEKQAVQFPAASRFANTKLTYKIIDAPNRTYGYEIYADGRLMIRQASAPALPGNEGFKTKKGAEAVAGLVIEKIKKGQMPPTVEIEEMKKLKAIP